MNTARYIAWHYTSALKEGMYNWFNFIVFFYFYFSIPLLFRTLFSRYGRLGEQYKKGFHPGDWIATFIVNTLMRIVGVIFRSIVILCGLIAIGFVGVIGVISFVLWLVLPAVVVLMLVYGFVLVL
tara:strand:- start:3 stop:377 length:375 start_codon:yes stop_codon:yes gene_type:complete